MSHISTLRVKFENLDLLKEALRKMGFEPIEEEGLTISGAGKTVKVDMIVKVPYSAPIGFRKTASGVQMKADWFLIQMDRKKFTHELQQQYAYLAVMSELKEKGFHVAKEDVDEKNQIHIVLRRN